MDLACHMTPSYEAMITSGSVWASVSNTIQPVPSLTSGASDMWASFDVLEPGSLLSDP